MIAVLTRVRDAVHLLRGLPAIALARRSEALPVIEHDVRRWVQCLELGREEIGFARQLTWLLGVFPEFRNLFHYRLGPLRALLLRPLYRPLRTLLIDAREIGPGLFIQHGYGTLIVTDTIGEDCWINQQVTIGHVYDRGSPVIGNRVTIAAGAVVVGPVTIGDDATVGANATIVKDVPAGGVAVSGPTRIIRAGGSRGDARRVLAD